MSRSLIPLALLAALSFAPWPVARATEAPTAPASATAPAVPALQRMALIGASISAGFGLDPKADPFSGKESSLQLAHVVEASLLGDHEPLTNTATMMFFTAPEPTAKRALADIKKQKPSAIVALDYLFWMAYGAGSDKKRTQRVEDALKLLEPFQCPVLLGDLPDFNRAGASEMMLPKTSIPSPELLVELQKTVAAWATKRSNVVLVPAGDLLRSVIADEEFEVRGNKFGAGSRQRLLQADGLHTTLEGTAALWVAAVDAWLKADEKLPAEAFEFDVAKIAARARELAAAPRDAGKKGPRKQ